MKYNEKQKNDLLKRIHNMASSDAKNWCLEKFKETEEKIYIKDSIMYILIALVLGLTIIIL